MTNKKDESKEIPIQFFSEGENSQAEETDDPAPEVAADDPSANEDSEQDPLAALQAQIESMTQERSALYDQLLRRQAEFENYRRRIDRERSESYARARAEVVLELLPVVDNFERAISSLEKSGGDAESLRHGVELIHKQFKDALTKFGLEPVESVGQAFDPHVHEAVTIEPTDKHKENTVIEEFQRGYKLGEKLLRPAKVKVASSPER
jgi:molecular chaperone GrpE